MTIKMRIGVGGRLGTFLGVVEAVGVGSGRRRMRWGRVGVVAIVVPSRKLREEA